MKLQLSVIALLAASLAMTACSKQESAPAADQASTSEVAVEASDISAEQQAAIDAIDQPLQDENNTDVPEEVANAPADQATAE
ncbi:hypothetical protein [Acinetobacter sp. YH12239]|uniref:hypothetical protein n=1 Tax=Acinetobacter sp. YH12239 TaxID=2601166 RepID=UPI0015D3597C|nr:hypothetical protein [Acinetobacter sp. YH12239]